MDEKLNELEADVKKFVAETADAGDVEAEAVGWLALGLIDLVRDR